MRVQRLSLTECGFLPPGRLQRETVITTAQLQLNAEGVITDVFQTGDAEEIFHEIGAPRELCPVFLRLVDFTMELPHCLDTSKSYSREQDRGGVDMMLGTDAPE